MSPAFPIRALFLLIIPVALAAMILAVVGKRGASVFKKQGVAWGLTVLMIFAAVGIGYAKSPAAGTREPEPDLPNAPSASDSFVWDEAGVLSDEAVRELDRRNERLWRNHRVSIGVVTCNYGRDDLGDYALDRAENMGLGGYDMIVVLDIRGDNYFLLQGNDISWDFTYDDCSDYLNEYLEYGFARGMYGDAVLELTRALEIWYDDYYG